MRRQWFTASDGFLSLLQQNNIPRQRCQKILVRCFSYKIDFIHNDDDSSQSFGTIEAVKTVSDLFLPVSGEVLEFNESLNTNPELVNKDPYGKGWIVKIRMKNKAEVAELLTAAKYSELLGG